MSNDYYNHGTWPATSSSGSSALARSEMDLVTAGFAKLAALAGNAGKFTLVNATSDGQTVSAVLSETAGVLTATNLTISGILTMSGALTGVTDLTTTGNAILGNAQADTLNVGNGDLIKTAGGLFGVGVTPLVKLHVKSAGLELLRLETTIARGLGSNYINFRDPTGDKGYVGYTSNSADTFAVAQLMNADMLFYTNGAEKMRLTAAGDVSIGSTGATYAATRLNVKIGTEGATVGNPNGLVVARAGSDSLLFLGYNTTPDAWLIGATFSSTGAYKPLAFATSDLERMRVMTTGPVVIGATSNANVGAGGDTFAVSAGSIGLGIVGTTVTAQINVQASGFMEWVNRTSGGGFKIYTNAGGVVALTGSSAGVLTDSGGNELGYKGLPSASVNSGAFIAADRGKCVYANGGVTVPNSTMSSTDVVTIYNNTAGAITISAAIATLRLAGTTSTGARSLAARGLATVLFISATEAVISGAGVS